MVPEAGTMISCVGDENVADRLKEQYLHYRRGTVNDFFVRKSRTLYITLFRHDPSSVKGRW